MRNVHVGWPQARGWTSGSIAIAVVLAPAGSIGCNRAPDEVYVPAPDYRQTLEISTADGPATDESPLRVATGSPIVLSARRTSGPWRLVTRNSIPVDACWLTRPAPAVEREVAANLHWRVYPHDVPLGFNLDNRSDFRRVLQLRRPGRFIVTGESAAWCDGPHPGNPLTILVQNPGAAVQGLDHIPLAVNDLEPASNRFEQLGFTLKPGRNHANGLVNRHAKFADGTEIELISVAAAASSGPDALSREYRAFLQAGDGPAFAGLYAEDPPALERHIRGAPDAAIAQALRGDPGLLSFASSHPLRFLFFGTRMKSPTDQPGHFRHRNGAEGLSRIWLAGDDLDGLAKLLRHLGASVAAETRPIPDPQPVRVASFEQGEVLLLPGARRLVPGRPIVGVTIRTSDLSRVRDALAQASIEVPPTLEYVGGASLFVAPELAHGLWIEFHQQCAEPAC